MQCWCLDFEYISSTMTSWMREDPNNVTTEEYILGKRVDVKTEKLGTLGQINAVEYDCVPQSIFASEVEHQVDLQKKLKEDPLSEVMARTMEARRRILQNPIKMKQLEEQMKSSKRHKSKKKKHKKEKKSKHFGNGDDSDDSDSDIDAKLLAKLGTKALSQPKDIIDKEDDHEEELDAKLLEKLDSRGGSNHSRRDDSRRHHRLEHDRDVKDRSPIRRSGQSTSRHEKNRHDNREKKRSDRGEKNSEEERARKLSAMLENGKWRDEQRKNNVKQYRKEDAKHEKDFFYNESSKDEYRGSDNFIASQLSKHIDDKNNSLDKRINSSRHRIQRNSSKMNENFAKR